MADMAANLKYTFIALILVMTALVTIKGDGSYEDVKALQDSILSSSNYSTNLRPVKNQTKPMRVQVSFSLVAIVAVDDVRQVLITNGFVFLFWDDEVSSWDESKYEGFNRLAPDPKQVWRPRLAVVNTVEDRDIFGDDYSHVLFRHEGDMGWVPGGLFHTYCALKMEKFPFDVQTCSIEMLPIGYTVDSLVFDVASAMNLGFYIPNPGWDLLETDVTTKNVSVVPTETFSCPNFIFKIKRRSANIVLNVILPVMFMSLLNNFVFFVPGESGEKISYAITVLLSLTVFLSMVSTMTPQVSDAVPALTIYLFVLLLSSVFTVAAAICTVYLQHKEQAEDAPMKVRPSSSSTTHLVNTKSAVGPTDTSKQTVGINGDSFDTRIKIAASYKYGLISRHINTFFFILVTSIWMIVTIWYFAYVTS